MPIVIQIGMFAQEWKVFNGLILFTSRTRGLVYWLHTHGEKMMVSIISRWEFLFLIWLISYQRRKKLITAEQSAPCYAFKGGDGR